MLEILSSVSPAIKAVESAENFRIIRTCYGKPMKNQDNRVYSQKYRKIGFILHRVRETGNLC